MDWRNEESDQSSVENIRWDENGYFPARTRDAAADVVLDRNVCSQAVQTENGICKDITSFTSALENLELLERSKNYTGFETCDAQTDYFDSEQEDMPVFKTREKTTFQLVIQGPEILNFQGTKYLPEDIAPYWKKDSRMWLWKSVRLARKMRTTTKAPIDTLT